MYVDPPWFNPHLRDALHLTEIADRIRPTLTAVGEAAAAACIVFDASRPLIVPGPQFTAADMSHLLGLISFSTSDGDPFSYNPMRHILPLEAAGQRVVLMAILARHHDPLEEFVEAYWKGAAQVMADHGPVMDQVARFYIWATPRR